MVSSGEALSTFGTNDYDWCGRGDQEAARVTPLRPFSKANDCIIPMITSTSQHSDMEIFNFGSLFSLCSAVPPLLCTAAFHGILDFISLR